MKGTLVSAPTATQVEIRPHPLLLEIGLPFTVTLLFDTPSEIAHLQPGDEVEFAGARMGSQFVTDQYPLGRNPHRYQFFAQRTVFMSRPPP
jgi:hypothetical protein